MGQAFSCFKGDGDKNKSAKRNGDSETNPEEKTGYAAAQQTLDEFAPKAPLKPQIQPGLQKSTTSFDISMYAPPAYSTLSDIPHEEQRNNRWKSIPASVRNILMLWRRANELKSFGHSGAWDAYVHRHGHIWLDSAHMLEPITQTAILLYAAQPLLIGSARKCNMTFFFTTFPNVKSAELDDKERQTLMALIEVFNSSTYRSACDVIKVRHTYLEGEKMQEFVDDPKSFEEGDDAEQKLVKLLRFTRQQMQKYWYGWDVKDLTFAILKHLYRMAIAESQKQPKLLNNNSFLYCREIGNYKRLLNKEDSYNITCTFLLATPLTPTEVQAIQKYQKAGVYLVKKAKKEAGTKLSSLFKGGTAREDLGSPETADTVAQELEKQGHPFCIEAIVFSDYLGKQAIDGYEGIDNFLDGTPDDINDVTFASQKKFIISFFHERWIFKTTTPHDPRVDNWPELEQTPQYNLKPLAEGDAIIQLPSVELVLEFVFGIVEETSNNGLSNDDVLENLQREAGINKPIEAITDAPRLQPSSVSAGAWDKKAPVGEDTSHSVNVNDSRTAKRSNNVRNSNDLFEGF